ncbi:hypothetical protein HGM15179_021489 [Zosterops borbonicus]|uniref:SH3 domain-containing protein n=1 Tax=Zosterops borbonicus TaxID=364589 RepID=A0A8K1FT65_9PASS|nr:hypothetical protein HGM15179_021489 [Zosterops borbonicus]
MESTQPYSGVPPPPGVLAPPLRLSPGDVIEVTVAEAEELWWQGRNVASGELGWFPSSAVRPFVSWWDPKIHTRHPKIHTWDPKITPGTPKSHLGSQIHTWDPKIRTWDPKIRT